MNTDKALLVDGDLSHAVLGAFYAVYRELGHGFLETVYENALAIVLRNKGIRVVQQAPIEVRFRGLVVGTYRADLLVPGRLLIEVKCAAAAVAAHEAQLLNYL